jgi:MraZ protein
MFRGTQEAKVDDKGRLKLPADVMKLVAEKNYGAEFFVTSRDGKVAEIWPMQEWVKEEEKKAALPEEDEAKTTWMRVVNFFGGVVEIDKQDRLMLPRKIRERFSMVNVDVVVTGQQRYLMLQVEQEAELEIASLLGSGNEVAGPMSMAEARKVLAAGESRKAQES